MFEYSVYRSKKTKSHNWKNASLSSNNADTDIFDIIVWCKVALESILDYIILLVYLLYMSYIWNMNKLW